MLKFRLLLSILVLSAFSLFCSYESKAQGGRYPVGTKADSLALVGADWHWKDVYKGQVGWAQVNMFGSVQTISIIRYPARKYHTEVVNYEGEKAVTTSQAALYNLGVYAINGSYFTREVKPSTFVKDDGERISSTSPDEGFRVNGLLLLKKGKKTKMDLMTSLPLDNEKDSRDSYEALTSGPMLIEEGKPLFDESQTGSSFYMSRHPRSIVGYSLPRVAPKGNLALRAPSGRIVAPKGQMVYFIVIDGRFPGEADGASIPEATFIAKVLGLYEAMNLDGGGSSTLYNNMTGVVNHPSDNGTFDHEGERRVPNILMAAPPRRTLK